jgi:hypothetical protein
MTFTEAFALFSDLKSPYLKPRTVSCVYKPTRDSVVRHLGDREVRSYTRMDGLPLL